MAAASPFVPAPMTHALRLIANHRETASSHTWWSACIECKTESFEPPRTLRTSAEFAEKIRSGRRKHPLSSRRTGLQRNSGVILQIGRMMKKMPYIAEHLSSLRQEIADLRNLNARFAEKGDHNVLDQTALELRTN